MARVYEYKGGAASTNLTPQPVSKPDPVTQGAVGKFWLWTIGAIVCSVAFYVFARRIVLPRAAFVGAFFSAAAALFFLLMMGRSVHAMIFRPPAEEHAAIEVEKNLQQLDDRFSLFSAVRLDEHLIDHIVVGPSGVFVIDSSPGTPRARKTITQRLASAGAQRCDVANLIWKLVPQVKLPVEAIVCFADDSHDAVKRTEEGVWTAAAGNIVPALLKRSGREGAISSVAMDTGAFSADQMQASAVEQVLAREWGMVSRKTLTDYIMPIGDSAGGAQ